MIIKSINTEPERDPMHADTNGVTLTELYIDLETGHVWVGQESDNYSISSDVFNRKAIAAYSKCHPTEDDMRAWIEGHRTEIENLCTMYRQEAVGSEDFDELEECLKDSFRDLCENENYWDLIDAGDYLQWDGDCGVEVDMTDTQLKQLVNEIEPNTGEGQIVDGIYEYLLGIRSRLEAERDED